MKIPDELLSAFVSGELKGADRQRVEQAIARDRRIAQRVAHHRALSGEVLHHSMRGQRPSYRRPVPYGSAQIIDLASVRAERAQAGKRRRNTKSPRFMIIASLAIGLMCGAGFARLTSDNSFTQYRDGMLVARGDLARALDQQLGGSAPLGTHIRVSATYKSRLGNYCRSFSTTGSQPMSGFACRVQDQWQLQTLSNGSSSATFADLSKNIVGVPLAITAEMQVRAGDWK